MAELKLVREAYLFYVRQLIDDVDIEVIVNGLKSNNLITDPAIQEFETEMGNYVGAKYAVLF